ncbi:MAG: SidA/IucD/PvdA family monooxygenase, partial [Nocardioidaceae bacterium]|nr:SidA/IucD/PvdA family monooxygenase [Nocardioidaceae bacterium]
REQRHLSKGISGDLVDAIIEPHYQHRVAGGGPRTTLLTNTQVCGSRLAATEAELELQHTETGESFSLTTGGLVLATGYAPRDPTFLVDIEDRIRRDARERYDVAQDYSVDIAGGEIFVQNAEEHTHSLLAPDLGMGPYRNSVILAAMLGREPYPIEKRVAVQTFGVPDRFRFAAGHATVKDAR